MTRNAVFPIQPTRLSTPPGRCSRFGNSSPSVLLSTPRSHRTPTRPIAKSTRVLSRMSPSPRVAKTPVSLTKIRSSGFGDRFIPSRRSMNVDMCRRSLFSKEPNDEESRDDTTFSKERKLFEKSLLSSLCDYPIESLDDDAKPKSLFRSRNSESRFCAVQTRVRLEDPYSQNILGGAATTSRRENEISVRQNNSRRAVSMKPHRVLFAEGIVDDYYMDHLSWNDNNVLAIAIEDVVYLYDYTSATVSELTKYEGVNSLVYSVSWCNTCAKSRYLAIGTENSVEIWDTQSRQKLRSLPGHVGSVPSLSWNHNCLTTGGADSKILHHDIRCQNSVVSRCLAHEQRVVKLQWDGDGSVLASGGNDDLLCIWDLRMSSGPNREVKPRLQLREHKAAVKAIDWSPHRRGLLASGGGSKDQTIKIWNSQSGAVLSSTHTGSQVSSVIWSQHRNELCSSHGFSKNVLSLWKQGRDLKLTKMTDFIGHSSRILSTACSPDGSMIASAGADENLCFFNVFDKPVRQRSSSGISSVWGEASLGRGIR